MRASNLQNPHASYMLQSILFVRTKIGRIFILLGGMIYGRKRIIFFDSDTMCVIFSKIPRTRFSKKKYDASEGYS